MERRRELTRLFDLTRDILLTTERDGALAAIARHVARRFDLDVVAICRPAARGLGSGSGRRLGSGSGEPRLDRVLASATGVIEFDARTRAYGGHRQVTTPGGAGHACAHQNRYSRHRCPGDRRSRARAGHARCGGWHRGDRDRAIAVSRGSSRVRVGAPESGTVVGTSGLAQPRSAHPTDRHAHSDGQYRES